MRLGVNVHVGNVYEEDMVRGKRFILGFYFVGWSFAPICFVCVWLVRLRKLFLFSQA